MENRTAWLWAGLAASIGLWLWSRTQSGAALVSAGFEAAGQAAGWLMSQARGIRNNNPGNIEHSADAWEGMAADQTDPTFVQFTAPEWGIRAMVRIMRTHYNAGQHTVRELITTWAPPTENNTDAYVAAVAQCSGLDPDTVYAFDVIVAAIAPCVILEENGQQPYPPQVIAQGITLESTA
jgi:hypothetical protein